MDDMDLVISPSTHDVVVNPQSPNIPSAIVKRAEQPTTKPRYRADEVA